MEIKPEGDFVWFFFQGLKESSHCPKSKDHRTHPHREAGAGAHSSVSLPGHTALCFSDTEQTSSHPGWVMRNSDQTWTTVGCPCYLKEFKICSLNQLVNSFMSMCSGWCEISLCLSVFVTSDYVSGGEMFTHLYQRDHFSEEAVRIYIGEIILALEHLHKVCVTSFLLYILNQHLWMFLCKETKNATLQRHCTFKTFQIQWVWHVGSTIQLSRHWRPDYGFHIHIDWELCLEKLNMNFYIESKEHFSKIEFNVLKFNLITLKWYFTCFSLHLSLFLNFKNMKFNLSLQNSDSVSHFNFSPAEVQRGITVMSPASGM